VVESLGEHQRAALHDPLAHAGDRSLAGFVGGCGQPIQGSRCVVYLPICLPRENASGAVTAGESDNTVSSLSPKTV
jgi:hypothetical protein